MGQDNKASKVPVILPEYLAPLAARWGTQLNLLSPSFLFSSLGIVKST